MCINACQRACAGIFFSWVISFLCVYAFPTTADSPTHICVFEHTPSIHVYGSTHVRTHDTEMVLEQERYDLLLWLQDKIKYLISEQAIYRGEFTVAHLKAIVKQDLVNVFLDCVNFASGLTIPPYKGSCAPCKHVCLLPWRRRYVNACMTTCALLCVIIRCSVCMRT